MSEPVTLWLNCPDCDEPAIPSRADVDEPLWTEDMEADCPLCGNRLRANITEDGMDAAVVMSGGEQVKRLKDALEKIRGAGERQGRLGVDGDWLIRIASRALSGGDRGD